MNPHFLYLYGLPVSGLIAPQGHGSFLPILLTVKGFWFTDSNGLTASNCELLTADCELFSKASSLPISDSNSSSDKSIGSFSVGVWAIGPLGFGGESSIG